MALNNVSDLLQGIKRLFVGMQGVKSDLTMETIKTNNAGALKVSAELTGSSLLNTNPIPITDNRSTDTQILSATKRKYGNITIANGADAMIWTPTAGYKIRVSQIILASDVKAILDINQYSNVGVLTLTYGRTQLAAAHNSIDILPMLRWLNSDTADRQIGFRNQTGAQIVLQYWLMGEEY